MFADDIVLCVDDETDMTEYLGARRRALEDRGMRITRPNPQFMDFNFGQDNGQGREPVKILGEELQRVHHFTYIGLSVEETGCITPHDNINGTESECSMEKLEEIQWHVVWQEDDSEPEGKGLQNCGQTSFVVWCSDLGNNERTRSTTRRKLDEDDKMYVRSDKEG